MSRRIVHPYGQSISSTRFLSMLMMLGLLWIGYGWAKNPANWHWLAESHERKELEEAEGELAGVELNDEPKAASKAESEKRSGDKKNSVKQAEFQEVLIPGPNDLDQEASAKLSEKLGLITDRGPLRQGEMPMYWELMAWSRTQKFADLKKRAEKELPFSTLWGDAPNYRGKLLHLRLHVRRVLHYKSDDNPLKAKDVYEAWGWTDDSKSYPYVVVFSERPDGLPIGTDIRAEMEFTGYFFKIMSYTAFDVSRGAPLLIGKVRMVKKLAAPQVEELPNSVKTGMALVGITALVGFGLWTLFRKRPTKTVDLLPDELGPIEPSYDHAERPNLPVV